VCKRSRNGRVAGYWKGVKRMMIKTQRGDVREDGTLRL